MGALLNRDDHTSPSALKSGPYYGVVGVAWIDETVHFGISRVA
ncbi:uncharacterized protein G2W53_025101 [Senna tora]|uniref:Uncharacterized protein n=1 Tax=Senna tora TaxID=362788 RepID=A0A834TEC9_9FABA|nr:uncharacterized protein G2W53_025101 [Senna tora]